LKLRYIPVLLYTFQELIPYAELKDLLKVSSGDVVYFNCLSKFFLNVYVKSRGKVNGQGVSLYLFSAEIVFIMQLFFIRSYYHFIDYKVSLTEYWPDKRCFGVY